MAGEPVVADEWLAQARRGVLQLCVLQLVAHRPRYGYELATELGRWEPLATTEGTLYPLLRRLQRDGLITGSWEESAAGPPRKYYRLTAAGHRLLRTVSSEWDALSAAVAHLRAVHDLNEEDADHADATPGQPAIPGRAHATPQPGAAAGR